MAAYLADGLWLRLAAHANERMRELMAELGSLTSYGVRSQERVEVNMAFVEMPGPALDAACRDGRIKKGDLVLMEAMGGGFTWGAVLVRW